MAVDRAESSGKCTVCECYAPGRVLPADQKQTTVRIDADMLEWSKSKGEGHLTRINEILRERMLDETAERR